MTHNYEGNAGIPLYVMRFYRKFKAKMRDKREKERTQSVE